MAHSKNTNDKRIDQLIPSTIPLVGTDLFAIYNANGTRNDSLDSITSYVATNMTGVTSDTYVTGATLNVNSLELGRNQGLSDISVDLSSLSFTGNTVTNGLTLSGGTTKLGGTLIEDTFIDGSGFDFNMSGNDTIYLAGGGGNNVTSTNMTQFQWKAQGPVYSTIVGTTGSTWPAVTLSSESSILELKRDTYDTPPFVLTELQRVSLLGDSGMVVMDSYNSKGLEYLTAYEANFTDYSLITKKFFDDNVPNDTYLTGVTLNSTTLELGRNQGLTTLSVDLSSLSGDTNTASNVGGGNNVFDQKVGTDLQFRTLVAGTNVTITSGSTTLTINSSGGGGGSTKYVSTDSYTGSIPLTITHNLGTEDVLVNVWENSPKKQTDGEIVVIDSNNIEVTMGVTNTFKVVIIG